jgi:hypothetical protein
MIINAILTALYALINLVLTPITSLNSVNLDSNFTSSIQTVSTYLGNMNQLVPVTTILSVLGLIVLIEGLIMLYKAINWLIRKIPTIN